MKTLEFKLNVTQQQQATIDEWLDVQKWVWRKGCLFLNQQLKRSLWKFKFRRAIAWSQDSLQKALRLVDTLRPKGTRILASRGFQ